MISAERRRRTARRSTNDAKEITMATTNPVPARRASATGIAFGTIVSASATPYGYTVSLWCSGAVLMHSHPRPGTGEVFLFAAGALSGFALLGAIAHGRLRAAAPLGPGREGVVAGLLHWFAVGIAVGAVALLAEIPSWIAWPLGSFAATTLYLVGATLQLALVARGGSGG
jgi:hypothetical protein